MNDFKIITPGEGSSSFQPIPIANPSSLLTSSYKPKIVLTSVKIPDDHIWTNGLFQNVYIIYKLLEICQFEPWILVNDNSIHGDSKHSKSFRIMDLKDYSQAPFRVLCYIEIGMSCGSEIRNLFRKMGAKITKLYLGNILNIDIETLTFLPQVNFSHHVAGALDEIWTSPHYDMNAEYAGVINGLCGKTKLAPYVWDPCFISDLGHIYNGSDFTIDSPRTFIIMEPNISYQKNSYIPILALEAYYRKYPSRVKEVIVINGFRIKDNRFFNENIRPQLSILKNDVLKLMPRANILNIARVFNNAIVLQHQISNEYNYSFFEWMTMGFPLIHNVDCFKHFGYYYDDNNFDAAADLISNVIKYHESNKEIYAAHTKQLTWRFSIYNPDNLSSWKSLVSSTHP